MPDRIEALRSALVDAKPPYCAGTLPVQAEDLILYYGKEDVGRRIDFSNVSEGALKHLSDTCDKATFGRNTEDVLDEEYRKAGKLDSAHFSTKIDVERLGFMNAVRYDLLEGHNSTKPIRAELYKLNVYGKDAFFKPHKDTPRGTTMFGSLVLVLPTPHEGGTLFIRHGEEWKFDAAEALSKVTGSQPRIAYAALFSDVEHEVGRVRSGYRVSLTYNLYVENSATFTGPQMFKTLPANEAVVLNAFKKLLEDDEFLPDGGYLGFGLRHEYPIDTRRGRASKLDYSCLKGNDALLLKVCEELGLDATLKVSYQDDADNEPEVLMDGEVDLTYYVNEDASIGRYLVYEYGADEIKDPDSNEPGMEVHWVTSKTNYNMVNTAYAANGNEPSVEYIYGQFCLIVEIGRAGKRETAE